jgi:hypothetical protein
VLVFDPTAVAPAPFEDADVEPMVRTSERPSREVGGFLVEAKRTGTWDTIVELLVSLDAAHPEFFRQVMRACRRLSNSGFEIDGLDDLLGADAQDMFDVAAAREQRREQQGYLSPAEARAFLQAAREIDRTGPAPPPNPIAHAYFRDAAWEEPAPDVTSLSSTPSDSPGSDGAPEAPPAAVADVMYVLSEAGVLTPQPRALLAAGAVREDQTRPLARLELLLARAREIDPGAWSRRTEELAFVANALVAGCSMQGRSFTPKEASDAAAAICNLGLENWPVGWAVDQPAGANESVDPLPDGFLATQDLIGVFQVGWTVLYEDVCVHVSERLARVLAQLQTADPAIRAALDALRFELARSRRNGTPWTPGLELDAIIMLDKPAWAALVGLFSECPVLHAALDAVRTSSTRPIDPKAFEFISENRQIAAIRAFMQMLPTVLGA